MANRLETTWRCRLILPTVTAILLVAAPSAVRADPVTIQSGVLETRVLLGLARTTLHGTDGFLLSLGIEGFRTSVSFSCTPCVAGSTVDLSGGFEFPRANGHAVVDGVTYPQIFADNMSGTLSTGSTQLNGNGDLRVSLEFTFTGVVNGYLLDPFVFGATDPVFTKTLSGSGTATGTFLFSPPDIVNPGLFTATEIDYTFGATSQTPEPATLLLCATASVALLRKRVLTRVGPSCALRRAAAPSAPRSTDA